MADPADVNVDELRRRARRRLVGAIVLALAAAVFVPMLLESDPKPLGEDVSVKIPPVDDGKFVNRLNDASKARKRRSDASRQGDAPRSSRNAEAAEAEPPPADARRSGTRRRSARRRRPSRTQSGSAARAREARRATAAPPPVACACRRSLQRRVAPSRRRAQRRATRRRRASRCSLPRSPTTKAPIRWRTS